MAEEQKKTRRRRNPPRSPLEYENRLIHLSYQQAEKQMEDGTAPAAVITHFLKLGTERERLERAKLEQETELARAKVMSLERAERTEEMFKQAIEAMSNYKGSAPDG